MPEKNVPPDLRGFRPPSTRKFTDIEKEVIDWLEKKQAEAEARLNKQAAEAFASAKAELLKLLDENEVNDMLDQIADRTNGMGIRVFYEVAAKEMTERAMRIREARATPEKDIFGDYHGTQESIAGNASEAGQTLSAGTREGDEIAGERARPGSDQAQGRDDFALSGQTESEIKADAEKPAPAFVPPAEGFGLTQPVEPQSIRDARDKAKTGDMFGQSNAPTANQSEFEKIGMVRSGDSWRWKGNVDGDAYDSVTVRPWKGGFTVATGGYFNSPLGGNALRSWQASPRIRHPKSRL